MEVEAEAVAGSSINLLGRCTFEVHPLLLVHTIMTMDVRAKFRTLGVLVSYCAALLVDEH